MGMHWSLEFEDAVIEPANYDKLAKLLNYEPEEDEQFNVDDLIETMKDHLDWDSSAGDGPEVTEEGIDLSGVGYWDSASYGFGDTWQAVLTVCRPGSRLNDKDEEEGEAGTTIYIVGEDGKVVEHSETGVHTSLDTGEQMIAQLGEEATEKIVRAWANRVLSSDMSQDKPDTVADGLRAWAKGMLTTMAAVELVIAAGEHHRSWVQDGGNGRWWIDFADYEQRGGGLSGGERRTWDLARSLYEGVLGEAWGLDQGRREALVAVLIRNLLG